MQRWTTVAIALALGAVLGFLVFKSRSPSEKPSVAPSASSAASKPAPVAPIVSAKIVSGDDGGAELSNFETLPSGAPVPELPASAPKAVSFGVILFMYRGSQGAPQDAPSRDEALAKARAVIPEAKKDFAEAVKKGDRGSTTDAGRIPRGVLEPAVEYVLFLLEKGAVSDQPIDTPRGFWVIKRSN